MIMNEEKSAGQFVVRYRKLHSSLWCSWQVGGDTEPLVDTPYTACQLPLTKRVALQREPIELFMSPQATPKLLHP